MKKLGWKYYLLIPIAGLALSVFWLIFMPENVNTSSVGLYILTGMINTFGIWVGCMTIVWILWIKFPWEQKPLLHLIIEVPAIIIYTLAFSYALYHVLLHYYLVKEYKGDMGSEIAMSIVITLLITCIHEAYFFYQQWKLNFSKSIKLEKDNINAKYEALKAQINPHFLFNSLNSLVTLVDGNDIATGYIMDLSDFLRYILKSREREVVLVREETEVLKKYINLQKARFGENLKIKLNIDEKYYHYALPPLVLQMLVENCIKHNIISKSKPLEVILYVKDESVFIENNIQKREDVSSTGNGLRNITERYNFLTTKNVEIKQTNSKFTVSVPIVLVDL